ncbi:TPA: hypothetical protein OUB66_001042 [Corynebacterium aurimucosum]|nr:hypothetical protein [Corynebacterium aurimucosum]
MRNFRTAAVAAATAASVAFAGTSVAFAAESQNDNENTTSSQLSSAIGEANKDKSDETLSSKIGSQLDKEDPAYGDKLLGKETDDENNPAWAKIWRDGTYAALGTAIAGALIAAYNFAVYNNIVPQHVLDPIFRR